MRFAKGDVANRFGAVFSFAVVAWATAVLLGLPEAVYVPLGIIIGLPMLAHGVYRMIVPDWRERTWWRDHERLAIKIGGVLPPRGRPGYEILAGVVQVILGAGMLFFAVLLAASEL